MQQGKARENRACSLQNFQVIEGGKQQGKPEETAENAKLEGYAVIFNSEAVIGDLRHGGWVEVIAPEAFKNCDMSDVCLKYNHQNGVPILARVRNKSLTLEVDQKGLKMRAELLPTQTNKDLYAAVQAGLIDKMSFGFIVAEGGEEITWRADGATVRKITKIARLLDVSIVDQPAYDATSVIARGLHNDTERRKALNAAVLLMRWGK